MQVELPFLLVLIPSLILFGIIAKRLFSWPHPGKPRHVAESSTLASLPSYKKVVTRYKYYRWVEYSLVGIILISLGLLVARPQSFVQKVNQEESRDIVMCLDASGSMAQNIAPSLEVMKTIVNQNPTDRYSIVLFQATTFPVLPLTRDVVAINDVIDELLLANEEDDFSFNSAGLVSGSNIGTDLGQGMLGCLRRFSDLETPRSRHVLIISDLEHNGTVNPRDAAALYAKYGIETKAIIPADVFSFDVNNSTWLGLANAEVSELENREDLAGVLTSIYASILNSDDVTELVSADNPLPYYVVISVSALAIGALRFRIERKKS